MLDADLGAFVEENDSVCEPTGTGPLEGVTFAVKDVIDVAGVRTGFGNPDWLESHPPAARSAVAVDRMLAAGGRLAGKTRTSEFSFSLTGENAHYGTPVNPACPDRIPGGSSSGSASAVAAGACEVALGTDCGGSVRIPASYCGILGLRPTHGHVSLDGVCPLAPSFDTVGWFARDAGLLEQVGRVLLAPDAFDRRATRAHVARDAFELVDRKVAVALDGAVERVTSLLGGGDEVVVAPDGLGAWMECMRTLQGAEIWASIGGWVREREPRIGPGVRERITWTATIETHAVAAARARRREIVERLDALLGPSDVLVLPTAPRIAPRRGTVRGEVENAYAAQTLSLTCIAGLAGLPQISLPLATLDGCPLGLSLIGPLGSDGALLRVARELSAA